ncbi:MAG: hypothetical protein ACYDH1_18450 [Anaerolineaceae bacterium]
MRIKKIFFTLPNRIRPSVSKFLFWVAERQPNSSNPYIIQLRELLKNGVKKIDEEQKILNAPKGTELNLLSIRLIEFFPLERQSKLRKNLLRLFPNNKSTSSTSFEEYFDQVSNSILTGHWTPIGVLYRDNRPFSSSNSYKLNNLPNEVDSINICLQKALPSLLIVTFDVNFSKDFILEFFKTHEKNEMHTLEVSQIIPKAKYIIPSFFNYQQEKQKVMKEFLYHIQQKIEKSIEPFFFGDFFSSTKKINKLPVIQVFELIRNNETKISYKKWSIKSRKWLESYGFSPYKGAFYNTQVAFIPSQSNSEDKNGFSNKLIVFHKGFLGGKENKKSEGNILASINYLISFFLNDILIPISLIEYLKLTISNIERTRRKIFLTLYKDGLFSPNLKKLLHDFNVFNNFNRNITRLLSEFEHNKENLSFQMSNISPKDLEFFDFQDNNIEKPQNLYDAFFAHISFLSNIVRCHIKFIFDEYSKFIETQNISAMYRLQNLTIFIALIALIISIIGMR